jgi:ribosomal protein S11
MKKFQKKLPLALLEKRKQITRNKFFFSRYNLAKIYLTNSRSNIFLTLCDLRNKVVIYKSSGISYKNSNSKKIKTSNQVLNFIVKSLLSYLRLYRIKLLWFCIKSSSKKAQVATLARLFKFYGFTISKIEERCDIAHNGVKQVKPRRV